MKIDIQCINLSEEQVTVVGLDWYDGKNGYGQANATTLAICYENGRLQLMNNESDPSK